MLDGFAIDRITHHSHESIDAWILSDEAEMPMLVDGPDQHVLEPAPPYYATAQS
jgi:hypothetical protein